MCGIFGIITKDERKFDYSTFCTLGVDNDSRGGDSCGICIDGEYEYGTGVLKYFEDFFPGSKILDKVKKSKIALGHCRKASIGGISEKTAQPVIIKDKSDKVRFVMLHNGTIYNYEKLAKKYIPEIDIKNMTDSQVMARIFYYKGYDSLEEYIGGSVFAIVDYRQPEPQLLLFKGSSKKYSTDVGEVEERPLYTTVSGNGELIFSSTSKYLKAIRKGQEIYTIRANSLITFNGTDLEVLKVYSRKNAYQNKETQAKYYYPTYYGQWDNYYESENNYGSSSYYGGDYISCDRLTNTYMHSGKPVEGKVRLSKYGRVIPEKSSEKEDATIWFFHGIAMDGRNSYNKISRMESKFKDQKKSKFMELCQNLIRYYSMDKVYFKEKEMVKATLPNKFTLFTGEYQVIGEVQVSKYVNGRCKEITNNGSYEGSLKSRV